MNGEEYLKQVRGRLPWITRYAAALWAVLAVLSVITLPTEPVFAVGSLIMMKLSQMDADYKTLTLIWNDRERMKSFNES
jgi:hypothetical protein